MFWIVHNTRLNYTRFHWNTYRGIFKGSFALFLLHFHACSIQGYLIFFAICYNIRIQTNNKKQKKSTLEAEFVAATLFTGNEMIKNHNLA